MSVGKVSLNVVPEFSQGSLLREDILMGGGYVTNEKDRFWGESWEIDMHKSMVRMKKNVSR